MKYCRFDLTHDKQQHKLQLIEANSKTLLKLHVFATSVLLLQFYDSDVKSNGA